MTADVLAIVLAGCFGLAVGLFNRRLVAGPLQRLRSVGDPSSAESRRALQQVSRRFLLRLLVSLLALLAVFAINANPFVLLAAVVGLVLPNALTVAAAVRERRSP